jgi:hypothetical protein
MKKSILLKKVVKIAHFNDENAMYFGGNKLKEKGQKVALIW